LRISGSKTEEVKKLEKIQMTCFVSCIVLSDISERTKSRRRWIYSVKIAVKNLKGRGSFIDLYA
jgi:hypothetical protein